MQYIEKVQCILIVLYEGILYIYIIHYVYIELCINDDIIMRL